MRDGGGEPILDIRNLTVRSHRGGEGAPVLDDVTLAMERGSILGLVGPSGAGKSTLARLAIGAVAPGLWVAAGTVRHQGADLLTLPARRLRRLRGRRIAFVAQDAAAAFNPLMPLEGQILEPVTVHGLGPRAAWRERLLALLEELGLEGPDRLLGRRPHQLSGGQLQRMMVAMALLPDPDLVILDEPTAALDTVSRRRLLDHLEGVLHRRHTAALLVSHDLPAVARLAGRTLRIQAGRMTAAEAAA
mgnify:CR=1 FL=1